MSCAVPFFRLIYFLVIHQFIIVVKHSGSGNRGGTPRVANVK